MALDGGSEAGGQDKSGDGKTGEERGERGEKEEQAGRTGRGGGYQTVRRRILNACHTSANPLINVMETIRQSMMSNPDSREFSIPLRNFTKCCFL